MKKIICIMLSLLMLLPLSGIALADDTTLDAVMEITTNPMDLNLSSPGEFNISYNIDNKSLTDRIMATAEYVLVDEDENLLWNAESDIRISAGGTKSFSFTGNVSKYGVHTLRINIKDKNTAKTLTATASVSLSKANIKQNENAGVSAHFAWSSNPNDTIPFLARMGSKFVRDEIYWEKYEAEEGVYKLSENDNDYINKLVENGLEPLVILNYSATANSEIPLNDTNKFNEFVEGFGEYVYHLVGELKGRVTYFEVWNELNTVDDGAHGGKYAKLLKTAYNKAKEANPDCKIIGPVTAGTSTKFFLGMKMEDSNISNYMDILSFHEYAYGNYPESAAYKDVLNSCVNKLNSNFGQDKEVWLSEMGYSLGTNGIDERKAAIYTVRQYLNNDYEKIVDKQFVYTWINQQNHSSAYEANLGLLNGDLSAKKGYCALAAMNSFLTGFEVQERNVDSNGNYLYTYRNERKDEVIVLYNVNDETKTVSVSPSFGDSILYDMYGNKLKDLTDADSYSVSVNGAPKYIVNKKAPATMDYKTNTAEIYGQIESALPTESVMLYVTKQGTDKKEVLSADSLVYIEQLKLGTDGTYEFSFPMNEEAGEYNVYIGYGRNADLIGPLKLKVLRDVAGNMGVYINNVQTKEIEDIKNAPASVVARATIDNKYNTELDAVFYAAGLKNNSLLWVRSSELKISGYGEHIIELDFNNPLVLDSDEIRLYLWRDNMRPISESVTGID